MSTKAHSLSFISKVGYIDIDIPSILSLSSLDGCRLNNCCRAGVVTRGFAVKAVAVVPRRTIRRAAVNFIFIVMVNKKKKSEKL